MASRYLFLPWKGPGTSGFVYFVYCSTVSTLVCNCFCLILSPSEGHIYTAVPSTCTNATTSVRHTLTTSSPDHDPPHQHTCILSDTARWTQMAARLPRPASRWAEFSCSTAKPQKHSQVLRPTYLVLQYVPQVALVFFLWFIPRFIPSMMLLLYLYEYDLLCIRRCRASRSLKHYVHTRPPWLW